MNGKTIQVDNTDAEGRLILADALHYSTSVFKPRCVVDLATLTGAMAIALGGAAAGVFTNSTEHWQLMHGAGMRSGDRVWRMPLWKMFTEHMKKAGVADLNNISSGKISFLSFPPFAFLSFLLFFLLFLPFSFLSFLLSFLYRFLPFSGLSFSSASFLSFLSFYLPSFPRIRHEDQLGLKPFSPVFLDPISC